MPYLRIQSLLCAFKSLEEFEVQGNVSVESSSELQFRPSKKLPFFKVSFFFGGVTDRNPAKCPNPLRHPNAKSKRENTTQLEDTDKNRARACFVVIQRLIKQEVQWHSQRRRVAPLEDATSNQPSWCTKETKYAPRGGQVRAFQGVSRVHDRRQV